MSIDYKYSKEACYLARRLLKTSQNTFDFIKAYHHSKGNLNSSVEMLNRLQSKLSDTTRLAREMCMSQSPMHNSTHVGTTNNAAVINNVALVSTYYDQFGQIHHSTSPTVFIFAVCLMVALFLALLIWFCKGAIGRWFIELFNRRNREQAGSSHQNSLQYAGSMDRLQPVRGNVYTNTNRQSSSVPEIQ